MMREAPLLRADFVSFATLGTRWGDNDAYGHVNNVVYYAWFDTAVNALLVEAGTLDPASSPVVGLVVDSRCSYFAPISFPESIEIGIAVEHLGRSSARYRLGVFKQGRDRAAAQARYTHVYVERATRRPAALPDMVRALLRPLML